MQAKGEHVPAEQKVEFPDEQQLENVEIPDDATTTYIEGSVALPKCPKKIIFFF